MSTDDTTSEALAVQMRDGMSSSVGPDLYDYEWQRIADAVLASDWLAAHVAAAVAEHAERIATAIDAVLASDWLAAHVAAAVAEHAERIATAIEAERDHRGRQTSNPSGRYWQNTKHIFTTAARIARTSTEAGS